MAATPDNPDLLVRAYLRSNRLAQWRARAAETAFSALALATFAGFALWVCDALWTRALAADAPWAQALPAGLIGLVVTVATIFRARNRGRQLAREHAADWLAAMPMDATTRQHARRRLVGADTAGMLLLALATLGWAWLRADSPAPALGLALGLGSLAGGAIVALMPGARSEPADANAQSRERGSVVAIATGTTGLRLLGAALEPAAARLPRSAPWVAFVFLLFPQSTPVIAVPGLVLLFTALTLALDLVGHWRARYLADQAWLAAQPLRPLRLFTAYIPYLFRRSSILCLLFGGCMHALGAPLLFALALSLLLAAAVADAVLCGFATRRTPARFSLLLITHGVIIVATTQVLPPALPLVWLGCAISAWRQGQGNA